MVYAISKRIFWPLFKLFIKDVKGVENLPDEPFIIAANHSSYIDAPLLLMLTAYHKNKKLRFYATNDQFKDWLWNLVFKHYGAIRVNGSLNKGVKAIKQGDNLGIFPEGGRTPNGKIQPLTHSGLGVIALKTGAPVVPVQLKTYKWWNRHRMFPTLKKTITITIGKPKTYKGKPTKQRAMTVVKNAMKEVKRLA